GTVFTNYGRCPYRTGTASIQAPRSTRTPVGQQCHLRISEDFDLAHNTVTTTIPPRATAFRTQGVAADAKRVRVFERLSRSIQRICHVRVDTGDAVFPGTCSHTAGNRFVVSKRFVGSWIDTADGEVVHGAGGRSGDALRHGLSESAEQNV